MLYLGQLPVRGLRVVIDVEGPAAVVDLLFEPGGRISSMVYFPAAAADGLLADCQLFQGVWRWLLLQVRSLPTAPSSRAEEVVGRWCESGNEVRR